MPERTGQIGPGKNEAQGHRSRRYRRLPAPDLGTRSGWPERLITRVLIPTPRDNAHALRRNYGRGIPRDRPTAASLWRRGPVPEKRKLAGARRGAQENG